MTTIATFKGMKINLEIIQEQIGLKFLQAFLWYLRTKLQGFADLYDPSVSVEYSNLSTSMNHNSLNTRRVKLQHLKKLKINLQNIQEHTHGSFKWLARKSDNRNISDLNPAGGVQMWVIKFTLAHCLCVSKETSAVIN